MKKLLQKVKKDYEKIAAEFNETRKAPWPEFEAFAKIIFDKRKKPLPRFFLDAGCGNGRLVDFLEKDAQRLKIKYVGIDNNRALLKLARKNHPDHKFRYGDIIKIPFPAAKFDTVWCIAVFHHLPSEKTRLQALKELKRVLKKNAALCLTVWNLWQPKYKKYIYTKTHDALIPWGQDKKIQRYYHAFRAGELKKLLQGAGFSTIRKIASSHNFAFVASK